MAHQLEARGKWTLVRVEGRIDGQTAPELETQTRGLLERGQVNVALDLARVGYVSSAGLRVFLTLFRGCQAQAGGFALVAPVAAVREVLEVSGFATVLNLVESEAGLPA